MKLSFKAQQFLSRQYSYLLIGTSSALLLNLILALSLRGDYRSSLLFWPIPLGFALLEGPFVGKPWRVFLLSSSLTGLLALLVSGDCYLCLVLLVVNALLLCSTYFALERANEDLDCISEKSTFLSRELKRLEATKNKFLDKSAKLQVKRGRLRKRSGRVGLNVQKAVYGFHREFLFDLLATRNFDDLASKYEKALGRIAVSAAYILAIDESATLSPIRHWGVQEPKKAYRALMDLDGCSFLDYLLEKRSMIEEQEISNNPMLEGARCAFSRKFFPPSLLIPSFYGDSLVFVVIVGPQDATAALDLKPTLFSPLLSVQEEIISLFMV